MHSDPETKSALISAPFGFDPFPLPDHAPVLFGESVFDILACNTRDVVTMIVTSDLPPAEAVIEKVRLAAIAVNGYLLGHTDESHFQKAMENQLREANVRFEVERIFPVMVAGTALRDVRNEIDILAYADVTNVAQEIKAVCIVVELKVNGDPEDACLQAIRYILGIHRAGVRSCPVYHRALVVNFQPFGRVPDAEERKKKLERTLAELRRPRDRSTSSSRQYAWSEDDVEMGIRNCEQQLADLETEALSPSAIMDPTTFTPTVSKLPRSLLQ